MENGLGHENWSWNKRFSVCRTDPWLVKFLLPSTLHKGNELLAVLYGPSWMWRRYLRPVGTIMFPGFVPMERSYSHVKGTSFWPSRTVPSWKVMEVPMTGRYHCSQVLYPWNARIPVLRNEFIPSRAVLGMEQQVHGGPVRYGYFSQVYLRPLFARFFLYDLP